MKLITIVKNLQNAGINITYRVRKDGGILVTEVDGMKFTGAKGNSFVRAMTGESLSEAQIKQRQKIKPPKRVSPAKRKKPPLPDAVIKNIKDLQKLYRKDKTKGKPTISNYRWVLEHKGQVEADRLLKQSEYYIKGIAYDDNIQALINRLDQVANLLIATGEDASPIYEMMRATEEERDNHREDFTHEKLHFLLQAIYDFENAWNKMQRNEINADSNILIGELYSDYMTTLRARYSKGAYKK